MSVPCHEGPPATKGHFSSEPAVAGRGRYYCSLYSTRHFTGNQCNSFSAAVMLCRSPRLIRSTTLAAERWTISRRCKRRSDIPYRTAFKNNTDVANGRQQRYRRPANVNGSLIRRYAESCRTKHDGFSFRFV